MLPCFAIGEIKTPKGYLLRGLWFGPKKPKRVIVWVHGIGSNMFSKLGIVEKLIDNKTAVVVFNNRGHEKISQVPHESGKFNKALRGGMVHEKFTDCADDIQGVINFVRRQKVKRIFLAGHSTGCQKSTYWASKKGRGVKGIVLLAPISDYSAMRLERDRKTISRALQVAQGLVRAGKGSRMLPEEVWGWPWIADAQRFVSLYAGKGPEEIFTYWDMERNPRTLTSVRIPALVILAENDEYADRPAQEIAGWFEQNMKNKHKVRIIPEVKHSFKGAERKVAKAIREFIEA